MPWITTERLVRALPGENDLVGAAHLFREHPYEQPAGVRDRLSDLGHRTRPRVNVRGRVDLDTRVGHIQARRGPCGGESLARLAVRSEPDAERLRSVGKPTGHHLRDEGRVDASRQQRGDRDVGHQLATDRLVDLCQNRFAPLIPRPRIS
jgi:hypothetical protein